MVEFTDITQQCGSLWAQATFGYFIHSLMYTQSSTKSMRYYSIRGAELLPKKNCEKEHFLVVEIKESPRTDMTMMLHCHVVISEIYSIIYQYISLQGMFMVRSFFFLL